jgi:hypothetical protein
MSMSTENHKAVDDKVASTIALVCLDLPFSMFLRFYSFLPGTRDPVQRDAGDGGDEVELGKCRWSVGLVTDLPLVAVNQADLSLFASR